MKCLLCGSMDVIEKEIYSTKSLAALWLNAYADISDELKLDEVILYKCNNCKLKFFDTRLAGGEKFYSELGKLDWYYLHPGKTEYDYVQKYIKDGDKILDVGAGRGVLFTKINAKVEYTGLELSSKGVELARESGINVIQENLIFHAEAKKSNYDIVCLFQVLEHLTELDEFIKSVRLSLKNGGLFVIAVPDNDGFASYTPNYTFNLPPHHTILWTEISLKYMAKKYGFEVVEVEHELLQDVHREIAYKSYIISFFKKIFFLPDLLIDDSKRQHFFSRAANRLYRNRLFNKLIMPLVRRKQRYGQSIIVTLRKK